MHSVTAVEFLYDYFVPFSFALHVVCIDCAAAEIIIKSFIATRVAFQAADIVRVSSLECFEMFASWSV